MIKKIEKKEIDKRLYKQETENLKNNIGKNNEKNEEFNRSKKSDDSMSWRKKSDNNEQDELGYGYNNNYGKKRRQRFKSDPNEYKGNDNYYNKKYNKNNDYQKDVEELRVQLDEVKYPIFS